MSKLLVTVGLLVSAVSVAHAETYVAVTGDLGSAVGGFSSGLGLGGGHRLSDRPLFVRASVSVGQFDDISEAVGGSDPDSTFFAEYLACSSSGAACGVFGADLGVVRTGETSGPYVDSMSSVYTQEQLVPQVGLDAGGSHLRVRATLESALGLTQRSRGGDTTSEAGLQSVMVGLSVLARF